jgi:hypothetical protein
MVHAMPRRIRRAALIGLSVGLLACSKARVDTHGQPSASAAAASALGAPVAPMASAAPLPSAVAVHKRVEGEGIVIEEQESGQVSLRTTSLWNEPIQSTYDDCTYYRNAIPVLQRQLAPERAKLLTQVCVH